MFFLRYGLKDGFGNLKKKQVHDVATTFMRQTPVNVHENVPDFEEARNCLGCVCDLLVYQHFVFPLPREGIPTA